MIEKKYTKKVALYPASCIFCFSSIVGSAIAIAVVALPQNSSDVRSKDMTSGRDTAVTITRRNSCYGAALCCRCTGRDNAAANGSTQNRAKREFCQSLALAFTRVYLRSYEDEAYDRLSCVRASARVVCLIRWAGFKRRDGYVKGARATPHLAPGPSRKIKQ